jgi:nucleoside phosphorylase
LPADVLVQAAIEPGLKPLLAALDDAREVRIGAWIFWEGKITGKHGEKSVVVPRTEVGPINAAAATALGMQAFQPAMIINQGHRRRHGKIYFVNKDGKVTVIPE